MLLNFFFCYTWHWFVFIGGNSLNDPVPRVLCFLSPFSCRIFWPYSHTIVAFKAFTFSLLGHYSVTHCNLGDIPSTCWLFYPFWIQGPTVLKTKSELCVGFFFKLYRKKQHIMRRLALKICFNCCILKSAEDAFGYNDEEGNYYTHDSSDVYQD